MDETQTTQGQRCDNLKVFVELELNVSDSMSKETEATLASRVTHEVQEALDWRQQNSDDDSRVLEARVDSVTPLLGLTIAERTKRLLSVIADRALREVPELSGVACVPLWSIASNDLPLGVTFVRKNPDMHPVAIRAALAGRLAMLLSEQAAALPEMISMIQQDILAKAKHAQEKTN